jgi:DNA/RNA-binding domain of Phe-tRNA-synthetase-like protein
VAINIEGLPPVSRSELESMAGELASMVEKYCGGSTEVHLLNEDEPSFETDL